MPEGHTTHRLAQRHERCYGGSPVAVSSPRGRFATAAAVLDGRVLQRVEALGKHLFHVYAPDPVCTCTWVFVAREHVCTMSSAERDWVRPRP